MRIFPALLLASLLLPATAHAQGVKLPNQMPVKAPPAANIGNGLNDKALQVQGLELKQGDLSFADEIVSYDGGKPKPQAQYVTPSAALGKPDYVKKGDKMSGFVSLGCKGSLVIRFTDNQLWDAPGKDLAVFEVGPSAESTRVEVSEDGTKWHDVGKLEKNTKSLDMAGKVPAEALFSYVRMTDLGNNCGGDTPGADIDAVASLSPRQNKMQPAQLSQQAGVICPDNDCDHDGRADAARGGDDCDDNDANRFPGNVEVADRDGHDEDCDPTTFGEADEDGDGYHASWAYNLDEAGRRIGGKDCDDTAANISPRSPEVCDEIDNNCNGETDEGLGWPHYPDKDGDRFGASSPAKEMCQCERKIDGVMWVSNNNDCDDTDAAKNPGNGGCG